MAKIPQHTIDEVKNAWDVVELVSGYVGLKKKGHNFWGLCPFHNEKTPSFSVNSDKQIFKCFGCGAGGDVISFIMQYEKTSYPEAIRFLAEKKNIPIPQDHSPEEINQRSEIEELYFINKLTAAFFAEQLALPQGDEARQYLRKRGFDETVIAAYGIGYAPDRWDGLFEYAKKESVDPRLLERAGLIIPKTGGYYDRFRHRLMFPISNVSGRVIAFGGRQMRDEPNSPKYLNSPESAIYHKSKVLYGLAQAKDGIRQMDEVIIVEGYADCISLFQFGIHNVAASSGTAFTAEQAQLIRRYTENVCLVYDGDQAGIRAAERGGAIMLEAGLNVKIVVLPGEHDPDSYVREAGESAMQQLVQKGQDYINFRVVEWLKSDKLRTANDKANAVSEMAQIIARMDDSLKRNAFIEEVARKLDTALPLVAKAVQKNRSAVARQKDKEPIVISHAPASSLTTASSSVPEKVLRAERGILRELLLNPSQCEYVFGYVEPRDFKNPAIQTLIGKIHSLYMEETPYDYNVVVQDCEEKIKTAAERLIFGAGPRQAIVEDKYELSECIREMQLYDLQLEEQTVREAIRVRELEKEDPAELMASLRHIADRIKAVRHSKLISLYETGEHTDEVPF